MPISLVQLDVFEDFFSVDLSEGALSFDVTDPFDNKTRTCRFVDNYEVARVGDGLFVVSAELEILP